MADLVTGMAAGAVVGAVATDLYEDAKEKAARVTTGASSIEHGPVELHMLVDLLANIERAIMEAQNRYHPRLERLVQWSTGNAQEHNRQGYKHVYVFSTTAFTVQATTKIGVATLNIASGLTALDLIPDHALVSLVSGTPVNVVYLYSDERYL